MHPETVSRLTENRVDLSECDIDFCDMEQVFSERLSAALRGGRWNFKPVNRDGVAIQRSKTKYVITSFVFRAMTADELEERAHYIDSESGQGKHEIVEWFEAISAHL